MAGASVAFNFIYVQHRRAKEIAFGWAIETELRFVMCATENMQNGLGAHHFSAVAVVVVALSLFLLKWVLVRAFFAGIQHTQLSAQKS